MASITLKRSGPPRALISLVPLVDVMLILLVFFMVTSTYLDLDMVPAVQRNDESVNTAPDLGDTATPLLIRLGANGQTAVRGQALSLPELGNLIRTRLRDDPLTPLLILPSGAAKMQMLISVIDAATNAGATRLRVIRLASQ